MSTFLMPAAEIKFNSSMLRCSFRIAQQQKFKITKVEKMRKHLLRW